MPQILHLINIFNSVRPRPFGKEAAGFSYPQGRALATEEGRKVEFKEFTGEERRKLPWKMMEKAKKFIIACLNAGNRSILVVSNTGLFNLHQVSDSLCNHFHYKLTISSFVLRTSQPEFLQKNNTKVL